MRLSYSETIRRLPPPWAENLLPGIKKAFAKINTTLVVMDDDPTGCQTVHDIPLLTAWSPDLLREEFECSPVFFILTNSRSLPVREASLLNREIARNLRTAASSASRRFMVISRSDSTLRGHFRAEVEALVEEFGLERAVRVCAPAFFEGGRFTIDDVHYVREGEQLVPAAETPYAKDPFFGFRSSNLKDYIVEKTGETTTREEICSIPIQRIREGGPQAVLAGLLDCPDGSFCIVNGCDRRDLDVVALALLDAMGQGKSFLFRTAAAIIPALFGQEPRPLLKARDFDFLGRGGGLVVVGSFVPMSSRQLSNLVARPDIRAIEIRVSKLLSVAGREEISRVAGEAGRRLAGGQNTVIYTSRDLVTGETSGESLAIQARVADGIVEIVRNIPAVPRYVLAKGGITSHDVAARALDVKRAVVRGQILPGVPVWSLVSGSRFPGLPYIVFPGNVGTETSLAEVVDALRA